MFKRFLACFKSPHWDQDVRFDGLTFFLNHFSIYQWWILSRRAGQILLQPWPLHLHTSVSSRFFSSLFYAKHALLWCSNNYFPTPPQLFSILCSSITRSLLWEKSCFSLHENGCSHLGVLDTRLARLQDNRAPRTVMLKLLLHPSTITNDKVTNIFLELHCLYVGWGVGYGS